MVKSLQLDSLWRSGQQWREGIDPQPFSPLYVYPYDMFLLSFRQGVEKRCQGGGHPLGIGADEIDPALGSSNPCCSAILRTRVVITRTVA